MNQWLFVCNVCNVLFVRRPLGVAVECFLVLPLLLTIPASLSASHLVDVGFALPDVDAMPVVEPASVDSIGAKEQIPDWDGIWRDTAILAGAQVVLFALPESVSKWSSEDKKSTFNDYADNFPKPGFDRDELYSNYVLHPYWGAACYIRGCERGLGQTSSLVFSTLVSAMYEFGIECFLKNRPYRTWLSHLVLSLWSVPSRETTELMTAF